ncbi:MAG: hypothetical protein ACFWTN_06955 [Clostridium sp.]
MDQKVNSYMLWNFFKNQYFAPYQNLSREIYIMFAARVITCLGGFIQPLLTLILTQKLGYSAAVTGGFSAFIILTQAPSLIIGGKLVDWIGRKKVLVFCQIAGSFFYLLCGLFPNHVLMLPFITLATDFYVAAAPAYESMTADYSTDKTRTASFSFIYLGVNIGAAVSSIFAGLLFRNHLRLMFLLDAATTLLAALLIAFFIKEAHWRKTSDHFSQEASLESCGIFSLLRLLPILLLVILFNFTYEFTYSQWGFLLPLQLGDYYGEGGAFRFSILTALNAIIVVFFTPVHCSFLYSRSDHADASPSFASHGGAERCDVQYCLFDVCCGALNAAVFVGRYNFHGSRNIEQHPYAALFGKSDTAAVFRQDKFTFYVCSGGRQGFRATDYR